MLAIPSHNFEDFPLKVALRDHIRSYHGEDTTKACDNDIQMFVDLRHQVLHMVRNSPHLPHGNPSSFIMASYFFCRLKAITLRKLLVNTMHK